MPGPPGRIRSCVSTATSGFRFSNHVKPPVANAGSSSTKRSPIRTCMRVVFFPYLRMCPHAPQPIGHQAGPSDTRGYVKNSQLVRFIRIVRPALERWSSSYAVTQTCATHPGSSPANSTCRGCCTCGTTGRVSRASTRTPVPRSSGSSMVYFIRKVYNRSAYLSQMPGRDMVRQAHASSGNSKGVSSASA
jgi:hypothetical protein